jgi:hypothetical protein
VGGGRLAGPCVSAADWRSPSWHRQSILAHFSRSKSDASVRGKSCGEGLPKIEHLDKGSVTVDGGTPPGDAVGVSLHPPAVTGARYLAWMYPSFVSSSAVSTAPPAAPRTVLWLSATKR